MTSREIESLGAGEQLARLIHLRSPLLTSLPLLLVGTAPLICHAWSAKAAEELRGTHGKKPKGKREAKNTRAEYEAAKYRSRDGWDGAPASGLKGAFVEGARFVGGSKELNMTVLKGALRVKADCPSTNLVRIYSPGAEVREDFVRIGQGQAKTVDLRYRPEYWPWFMRVTVQYPTAMFSIEQIADVIAAAGSFNGFCEWRPGSPQSKTGTFGTFEIGDEAAVAAFEAEYGVKVLA